MKLHWSGTPGACNLHIHDDEWPRSHLVGGIEYLHGAGYSACDMSSMKWEWRKFDDLDEAKTWLEVCARMTYALARQKRHDLVP